MRLSLIVAMNDRRVIGRNGDLPWRLSADLKRFKRLTMGHHLIMGRTTYDSIGRPLPGRTSLVLSRTADYKIDHSDVHVVASLDAAREFAESAGDSEAFVIGGGQIYELALPQVERMYVTHVDAEIDGDTFFPLWEPSEWTLIEEEVVAVDERNEFPSRFQVLDRRA